MDKIQLYFESAVIDPAAIQYTDDKAIVLNAAPMAVGDYVYYGFESDEFLKRGYEWNEQLIGRVTKAEAERILPQFEGLPVTDDHVWVDAGKRSEIAVGTVLKPGEIDGDLVNTRAVIHDPTAIVKITSGDAVELSIGFWNIIRFNDNKTEGEPDFFVESIDLNHVAVVKEGRAGPEARLSNHRAKLEKGKTMEKITINGVEFEVSKEVATAYAAQQAADAAKLTTLENSLAEVTTARDTAVGGLAAANAQLENSKGDAEKAAVKMAADHAEFVDQASKMGHATADLKLGEYDADEIRREILKEKGMEFSKEENPDVVRGAWLHAISRLGKAPAPKKSVLDNTKPGHIETDKPGDIRERQANATRQSYFGGKKSKSKKDEG